MIDGKLINNCKKIESEQTFETTGSLFELLDQCETPFGA
jgi:DNA mismatch repair ATPase MutS